MPSCPQRRTARLAATLIAAVIGLGLLAGPDGAERAAGGAVERHDGTDVAFDSHPIRTARTYRIAASARSRTVQTGETITIVGSVRTRPDQGRAKPRPVALTERHQGRWKRISSTRSSRFGAVTFTVDAGAVATTRTFRVETRRFRGMPGGATGQTRVRVVGAAPPPTPVPTAPAPATPPAPTDVDPAEPLPAGYVGAGDAAAWAFMFSGGGRWNPCRVIRWTYNPTAQGYDALADVQRAFAKISGVSGLRFTYVGPTEWRYLGNLNDPAFPSAQADIAVGWANELELPSLAGGVIGYGGGRGGYTQTPGADVKVLISRGYLVLDNGDVLPGGFDGNSWGPVVLHEILHSLGLGHVADQQQLMFPMLWEGNARFGAGDITGMQRVGAAPGCLS